MNLGERITALRNRKHLTQDQVAEALGVKRERYNAWENNISNPPLDMLAAIAKFHKVTVDFLMGLPHPEGIQLLTDDMYADGYTDETYLEDLEESLKRTSASPEWATAKDKRDFKKMLEEDAPVMFDGVPIEGAAKQRVLDVLTGMFWEAKEMNKKTYGSKKKKNNSNPGETQE